MGDISKNFSMWEFDCKDGTLLPPEYHSNAFRLVKEVLQPMRASFGRAITVHSGYRTEEYNERVDGEPRSQHLVAKAADIDIDGVSEDDVQTFVRGYMLCRHLFYKHGGGVGWYESFTHVDIRDGDHVAFWDRS